VSDFYEAGKVGRFTLTLGECRMHPAVYAQVQRGEHIEALKPVLSLSSLGEWDVIVTTEIPEDRVVFVAAAEGVQHVVMLVDEQPDTKRCTVCKGLFNDGLGSGYVKRHWNSEKHLLAVHQNQQKITAEMKQDHAELVEERERLALRRRLEVEQQQRAVG